MGARCTLCDVVYYLCFHLCFYKTTSSLVQVLLNREDCWTVEKLIHPCPVSACVRTRGMVYLDAFATFPLHERVPGATGCVFVIYLLNATHPSHTHTSTLPLRVPPCWEIEFTPKHKHTESCFILCTRILTRPSCFVQCC